MRLETVLKTHPFYNNEQETHPNRITWSMEAWRKLWAQPVEPPLKSIQILNYDYTPVDTELARREADKIERHLKEQFRDWRNTC